MKTIITLLLALCLFGQAQAIDQPSEIFDETHIENNQTSILLNSESYNVPEGLSQSTITSIIEDSEGYIWIGTLNGLNRFDGKEFKHYFADKSSGLPSSFIRSLLYTDDGSIFVGTDKGLAIYDPKLQNFKTQIFNSEHLKKPIWSISGTKDFLIVGTDNGIHLLKDLKIIESNFHSELRESKQVIINNNDIYVRNYHKDLYGITKGNFNTKPKKISGNVNDIIKVKDKLSYSKAGTITNKTPDSLVTNKIIHDKLFKKDNETYSISQGVIFKIDNDIPVAVGKIKGYESGSQISTIFANNRAYYIGFLNEGLKIVSNSSNLIKSITPPNKNTWHFEKVNTDEILISSDDKTIKLYNENLKLIASYNTGVEGFKNSLIINNNLYVGSYEGLVSIPLNTSTSNQKSLSQETITYLTYVEDTLYAGTASGNVLLFRENILIDKIKTNVDEPILGLLIKEQKKFYIASQSGFYLYRNEQLIKLYDELTYSLALHENGVLFGTSTSIMLLNTTSNTISKVFSNNREIYSIFHSKNITIASSLSEIIYIKNKKEYIFTTMYGSQHEYNTPSGIEVNNDTFLFGGIDGVSIVSLKTLNTYIEHPIKPRSTIDSFLIFNNPVHIGSKYLPYSASKIEKLKLNYSDYPFTFRFSSPNSSFNNIEYFYQMYGLSDDWISTKDIDSATYTNLSPGEYTFNVFSVDKLTNSKGPTKSITIEITPPWWLSKQAKFIYFMLSLIISGVIVKGVLRRREVQNQIAKSEERLKLSLWGSGDEMWDWDIETGQIYRSNIWGSLEFPRDGQRSGETGEESNIHPMDQERVSTALNDHFYGKSDHFEAAYRVKGKSDEWVWILDRAKIVERDEKDNPLRMTGTIKNINNFKNAEEQLRLFERAIANISEGMFILDCDFRFVEVNEACCELCLKTRDKFIGEQFNFDLYPDSYSEQIRTILNQQGRWSNDVESAKGDGSSFLMELTVDAIYDELGQLSHYVGVFSDISRRKQQEEELRKLTNNDLLTNLPNRSSLMVTLGNLVKRDSHHTLMVLDLDNFKKINDSLGHQIGDELLIKVAKRIEAAVPYHTSIYRLGGDEFAILVDDNPDIGSSAVIANSVIEAFVTPFELTSDKVVVGMSIGIVLYPEDDQNEQALLRKADIAMYHAKSGGGNRYQFYSESLNRNAIRQLEVENLIRQGIKEDLFEVYYQPKIALKSGKMAGMEALVRLNHPVHGLIPPSEFIPLAEENGLIVEIGDIVMKKACFAAQKWRSQGIFNGRVAVNLSSYQFALPDLQQRIESILRLTQLPAANLELEITEGTVIKEPEKAIKVMQQLSKMGVSLALDDFGTGYSSLSYLKRFPIHTLKIDKAFVDDIDKSDRDLKMVDSIITIAHNMGLSVVGEGVEDASQLSILKALNCEEIQGFIFSKPVTESQFTELLHKEFIEPDLVQNGKKAI
ncbi:PAS domain S-box/diguanylate cyclase (GGDEF) domain-containing protein [Shewanella psychrophila]|uniref:cyclic-guanylate-specific phosphodiesterase n=1 Tax=Shewanella psychrophila TaxID=225848 RepID=A0A1S6HN73_9GAMM|nr:EAL domain-containing protein [Shewanella psychrophila]AQS36952.1 PAS domain S-box/diguanylate cyclase (GGDEF) domain-containing protein [Shewanella psychrophila]